MSNHLNGSAEHFFPLQVTCYDWDSDGSHDLIGHFTTTLGEITEAYQTQKKACTNQFDICG